jgi:hypothetical protein
VRDIQQAWSFLNLVDKYPATTFNGSLDPRL